MQHQFKALRGIFVSLHSGITQVSRNVALWAVPDTAQRAALQTLTGQIPGELAQPAQPLQLLSELRGLSALSALVLVPGQNTEYFSAWLWLQASILNRLRSRNRAWRIRRSAGSSELSAFEEKF